MLLNHVFILTFGIPRNGSFPNAYLPKVAIMFDLTFDNRNETLLGNSIKQSRFLLSSPISSIYKFNTPFISF
jgi:hypothetical protein